MTTSTAPRPATVPLRPDAVLVEAALRSGLDETRISTGYIERLEVVCGDLRVHNELGALGRHLAAEDLVNGTIATLRWPVQADAVATSAGPLVIGGLGRTGTTRLHELAAASGPWRAMTAAVAYNPGDPAAGANRVDTYRSIVAKVRPNMLAIHRPARPGEPEECNVALGNQLLGIQPLIKFNLPTYREWFLANPDAGVELLDPGALTAHGPTVLKSPGHLFCYDAILDRWPDATVVHVARPARTAVASWVSLVTEARRIFDRRVDPDEIALEWLTLWRDGLDRATTAIERRPDRFLTVPWSELCTGHIPALGIDATVPTTVSSHKYTPLRDTELLEEVETLWNNATRA